MSLTMQHIINDAQTLCTRLKDHESLADRLISQAQSLYKQVDAMKQYEEEVVQLNEVAHQKPRDALVQGIQQENRHLRELQQENKELRNSLEEHQNTLEIVMSKYRKQVTQLMEINKSDRGVARPQAGASTQSQPADAALLKLQSEKICEMALVMRRAVELDEQSEHQAQEKIAQLNKENKGLRELLRVGYSLNGDLMPAVAPESAAPAEADSSGTSSDSPGSQTVRRRPAAAADSTESSPGAAGEAAGFQTVRRRVPPAEGAPARPAAARGAEKAAATPAAAPATAQAATAEAETPVAPPQPPAQERPPPSAPGQGAPPKPASEAPSAAAKVPVTANITPPKTPSAVSTRTQSVTVKPVPRAAPPAAAAAAQSAPPAAAMSAGRGVSPRSPTLQAAPPAPAPSAAENKGSPGPGAADQKNSTGSGAVPGKLSPRPAAANPKDAPGPAAANPKDAPRSPAANPKDTPRPAVADQKRSPRPVAASQKASPGPATADRKSSSGPAAAPPATEADSDSDAASEASVASQPARPL